MTLSAVLDTNVVLDWFVFGNAGVGPLAQAIESGTVRWVGCSAMQDELAHVLLHAHLAGRLVDAEHVLTSTRRLISLIPLPSAFPAQRLRCTDPSDQMFIDLALIGHARWLVTRDRALLKLRRRAAAHGLLVLAPEQWQAEP